MGCRHRRRGGTGPVLLAVCADQPLDEFLDGAGLRQVPLGEKVGQLCLGQTLVRLAGLLFRLPGRGTLSGPGLLFFFSLGFLGRGGLFVRDVLGLLGLLHGQVGHGIGLVLDDAGDLLGLLPDGAGH